MIQNRAAGNLQLTHRIRPGLFSWEPAPGSSAKRSQRSEVERMVFRPRASISEATSSTFSLRRPDPVRSAPASAKPRLNVRPMPDVPPIITTTLSARLMLIVLILSNAPPQLVSSYIRRLVATLRCLSSCCTASSSVPHTEIRHVSTGTSRVAS
jgi:hypothetical protein